MTLQELLDILGQRWELITEGLLNGMEFQIINISETGEQLWQLIDKEDFHSHNHPLSKIECILWKKLLYAGEITNPFNRYGYVCFNFDQPSENAQQLICNIIPYPEPNETDIEDEGMFLCLMKTGEYGFFNARNGSCGYNGCSVGGSYAVLYVGTLNNIYKFGMDNEGRRWHDILHKNNDPIKV